MDRGGTGLPGRRGPDPRKNLLALAEARIVEEKTSTPEFYDRLGVQDIALDNSARRAAGDHAVPDSALQLIIGETQAMAAT